MARATRSCVGGTTGSPSVTPRAYSSSNSSLSLTSARSGDYRHDDGGQDQPVDDEGLERPPLEIADEEPHGQPAADERRHDGDQQRTAFGGAEAMADQAQGLVRAGRRGDGDAEEKREAGGRRALE